MDHPEVNEALKQPVSFRMVVLVSETDPKKPEVPLVDAEPSDTFQCGQSDGGLTSCGRRILLKIIPFCLPASPAASLTS